MGKNILLKSNVKKEHYDNLHEDLIAPKIFQV